MIHNKFRYLMTLALLLTAVGGAWATDETLLTTITPTGDGTYSETTAGAVTVTPAGSFFYSGSNYGWRWDDYGSLTVTANEGYTITRCVFIQQGKNQSVTISEAPFALNFEGWLCYENYSMDGVTSIEVYGTAPAASSATTVPLTWDATAKTATLTNGMPAGNVMVGVEYFPQATMAEGAVTVATDVAATTDAPLVTIDETKLTGVAKLMYFVSTDAEATAPAYDAEGWTDVLPTAEKFTEAGNVNVWYYPVGTDENVGGATATYSDGDICTAPLAVTLGAAPTYAVTFADDLAEPTLWSAEPNADVKKGQTVTVTYTGTRKVIGVKAEKKGAAGKPVSEITPDDIFKVIASNGIIYDNIAAAESAGTVAQGLIVYVGSNTENENYNHGLALALNDENNNTWGEAINACNAKNTSTPIVDALWILPSQGQWNTMFNAAGGDWKLRDCFSSAGGNNMVIDGEYWSSTGDSEWAYYFMFSGHDWEGTWGDIQPRYNYICNVRACIVF